MAHQRVRRSAAASRKPRCAGASPRNLRARQRAVNSSAAGRQLQARGRQIAAVPKPQQLGAVAGHSLDDEQRMIPPAKLQVEGVTQLAAPPSRLRQQMLPAEQAAPLRQLIEAPPGQVD